MYKILASFLLLLVIQPVFASNLNTNTFSSKLKMNQPKVTIGAYQNPRRLKYRDCYKCQHHNPYLEDSNLSALEKYVFNKTYRRNSDLERLERLENIAFGATQVGNVASRYQNLENAILSRPKSVSNRSLLGNLANYFSGQPTGFTPSLGNSNFYPTYNNLGGFSNHPNTLSPRYGYNNTAFEQYSNGIFGGGWGISGNDYGTGTSVRILD